MVSAAQASRGTLAAVMPQLLTRIKAGLPAQLEPGRFARLALTELRRRPDLLQCSQESLIGAMVQMAQIGLEPGPLGHAYLVPYKGEIQLQIGYRGLLELARRSGELRSVPIHANVVYDGDEWQEWTDERGQHFRHSPRRDPERRTRAVLLTYAVAMLRKGHPQFVAVDEYDMQRIRAASHTGRKYT